MILVLFWLKIAANRIYECFKIAPIIIVTPILLLGLLLIAGVRISFPVTEEQFSGIVFLIFAYTLISTLKAPKLAKYLLINSGSCISFRKLKVIYFVKKSIVAIIPMGIFFLAVLMQVIVLDFQKANIIFTAVICLVMLLLLSLLNYLFASSRGKFVLLLVQFVTVYLVLYIDIKIALWVIPLAMCIIFYRLLFKFDLEERARGAIYPSKIKPSPLIKSTMSDYLTSSFLQGALVIVLAIVYIILHIPLERQEDTAGFDNFIFVLAALISFGFYMLAESVNGINWLYYAIINPSFKFHMKRTFLFVSLFFGGFILYIFFMILLQGVYTALFFLVVLFINLMTAISISFLAIRMITKIILSLASYSLIIYLGLSGSLFIFVLLIPVAFLFYKMIKQHHWWYKL